MVTKQVVFELLAILELITAHGTLESWFRCHTVVRSLASKRKWPAVARSDIGNRSEIVGWNQLPLTELDTVTGYGALSITHPMT